MRIEKLIIESSIPDLFVKQVHLQGKRLAIVTEDGCITYQELDRLANRIAGALAANGHRHGQTVTILVEQGILQIAAILGSLKAGGIYVPLDLALGRRRLHEIVQHADSHIVMTDGINRSTAKLICGEQMCVLNIEEDLEQYSDKYKATDRSPNDFAYIYYTSGTTGEPKGVVDTDRNVLHNIARYTASLNIGCNDRLTLLQSCGFSGAVSNIFAALLNGALLLPFDVRLRGVSALAKWLAIQEPTIYHSVPSLFRQLMRYCDTLPTLRIIRLEGDLTRAVDVETFNRQFDRNCTLVNGLGATETGITAQYFIEHGVSVPDNAVPVGKPTHGIYIDVVDSNGQSLEQGRRGEIVITSRYLANGYWNRSDLTQSAFSVIDAETRSYRTGDLGRIDRNGMLEVHGRVDSLAKIRGEWVDLSAIEAALARCIGVNDAIATVLLVGAGEPELTAWVVPNAGANVTSMSLRAALRTQGSPGHSIPTSFFILERWPLDINGKVDRKALPATKELQKTCTGPETALEKLVIEVYEQILGISPISRTDDFFELGGDSLKAIEACLELNRRTGSDRALGAMQHAPRVMELARILSGAINRGCLVPLQPRGNGPALFCVHAHMGRIFNLRSLAMQFAPEQIFFGLQAKGLDGLEQPDTTLEAMAATYISYILGVQPTGPYLIAGHCFGSWVAVEIARQLCDAGQQVNALFLIDPQLPGGSIPIIRLNNLDRRVSRFLDKIRKLGVRSATRSLLGALSGTIHRLRGRSLRFVTRLLPAEHWLSRFALRKPADAINVMQLDYRPLPYDGDACILMPCDCSHELRQQLAWSSYIKGNVDFEFLVGNAINLLRDPYTRDLAARLLARIDIQSED